MAHYEGVNESALINAIISCRQKVDKGKAQTILNEARALPIDGAGATDNIVTAAQNIVNKTNQLYSRLDKAYAVALDIAEYKTIKKELDKAKEDFADAQSEKSWHYSNYYDCSNKNSNYAQSQYRKYRYYKNKANELDNEVDSLTRKLQELARKLSAAGYPPV